MAQFQISQGEMAFHTNYIPSLEAGQYTVHVESAIEDVDTEDYFEDPITQAFEVRAPQFSLLSTEIHAVYPPDDSNARYGKVLPHVVLNKRSLPWERFLIESNPELPWLCLLVFKEGEIDVDEQGNAVLILSTVSSYLKEEPDVLKPNINRGLVAQDVLDSQCQSIKIGADVFKALVPRSEELPYLTHVREIDIDNQAITDVSEPGWFSVVVGNRFLDSGEDGNKYFIHLVSLEGFDEHLEGADIPKNEIQLVSLYNWKCVSQPELGKSFAELAENFVEQSEGDPERLLLRRYIDVPEDPDAATAQALERLNNGYVPISHQLATGETTFAWYRGPFTPVMPQEIPRDNKVYHYPSADSAMIYDKASGVFDQSYAAAWTLGRLLALAHGAFSQAVFRYRKQSYAIIGKIADGLKDQPQHLRGNLSGIVKSKGAINEFKQRLKANVGKSLTTLFTHIDLDVPPIALKSKEPPSHPVSLTQQLLSNPSLYSIIQDEISADDEDTITRWLARKQLLYDVPFNHLVADENWLPVEALRFFYLDQNWIDMLIDGALSVGVQSSKDVSFNQLMREQMGQKAQNKASVIRKQLLRGTQNEPGDTDKRPVAGLLIRSALVSGWPGLVVKGHIGDSDVGLLRMDHLSDSVLLCLFADIPETITLSEPDQGLCFGVEDEFKIILRNLKPPVGHPIEGEIFPESDKGFTQFYRPTQNAIGGSVLNINAGAESLISNMKAIHGELSPAEFAIQMVKAPEQLSFDPNPK